MNTNNNIHYEEYCPGRCPKCDDNNITYYGSEPCDDDLVYDAHCENCKIDFHEYYKVEYYLSHGIEYIKETEEKTQLSCCGDEMTGILEDIQICPTCKEHQ